MTQGKNVLLKDRSIVWYFIAFAECQQSPAQLKGEGQSWCPGEEEEDQSFEINFEACLALFVVVLSSYPGDTQYSKHLGRERIIYLCIVGLVKEKTWITFFCLCLWLWFMGHFQGVVKTDQLWNVPANPAVEGRLLLLQAGATHFLNNWEIGFILLLIFFYQAHNVLCELLWTQISCEWPWCSAADSPANLYDFFVGWFFFFSCLFLPSPCVFCW